MAEIGEMIDAKLFVLVPVLYLLGMAFKKSPVSDWLIPFLLAAIGTLLSFDYFAGQGLPDGAEEALRLGFSSATQGVLCAACSVYAKNLWKQFRERREERETL